MLPRLPADSHSLNTHTHTYYDTVEYSDIIIQSCAERELNSKNATTQSLESIPKKFFEYLQQK